VVVVVVWFCDKAKRYFDEDEENYGNTSLESESDGLGGAEGKKLKKKKGNEKKKKSEEPQHLGFPRGPPPWY
jgi:hypothetical protein